MTGQTRARGLSEHSPHPALALLKAGDTVEAIRCLELRGDHPSALAVLRDAGDALRAGWLLEGVPSTPPAVEGVSAQENRVSGRVGRAT